MGLFFMACSFSFGTEEKAGEDSAKQKDIIYPLDADDRKWTLLVYMSADNDLESAALEDICEMETSVLNTNAVTVLILLDRSPENDTSNGNWSGTRLYKLNTKREYGSKNMISEQLECTPLGLSLDKDINLDMSSPFVLSRFISFGLTSFPAENTGLIIWGHGSSVRSQNNSKEIEPAFKGFAYDDSCCRFMSLTQFGEELKLGLGGGKLSFIGFDTCFGGELEVMQECCNYADFAAGSEGNVLSTGWDYLSLFNTFQTTDGGVSSFCDCVLNQFKIQYSYSKVSEISIVNLAYVNDLYTSFNSFTENAVSLSPNQKLTSYTNECFSGASYLDLCFFCEKINEKFEGQCALFDESYEKFLQAYSRTVIKTWGGLNVRSGLGILRNTVNDI